MGTYAEDGIEAMLLFRILVNAIHGLSQDVELGMYRYLN